ncbi:hypothetical protein F2Q69_00047403, partial [Brassica cretica]
NLNASGLTGTITSDISKLTQLKELYAFEYVFLLIQRNLSGNPKLNLTVPESLQERVNSKYLTLMYIASGWGVRSGSYLGHLFHPPRPPSVTTSLVKSETRPSNPSIITKDRRITYPEVELLLRVHHRHLVGLVGYCDDGDNLALIYEYMANGDLRENMSGKRGGNVLTWENRMQIAVEAAQGLEYLHDGCRPPMVHRDVKTTNILLNDRSGAKLVDFGLSRSFSIDGECHVSTVVAGTPGYLDPEYYRTNWLSEKSDVYSFRVVLLEIVTNQPVIDKTRERPHINEWVGFMLTKGDIRSIVDPKLMGDYDTNGAWKIVEVALGCVQGRSDTP